MIHYIKTWHFKKYYTVILFLVLVLLIVLMSNISEFFLTKDNILNVLNQSSIDLIISLGMIFAIASKQTDLSIGATMGAVGLASGMLYKYGAGEVTSLLWGIGIAVMIGLINGVCVAYGKIDSFIATLAVQTVIRGIILVITQARPYYNFGPVFRYLGTGELFGIKLPIIISFILTFVCLVIFNYTKHGHYVKFLGSNEVALHRMGVNANKIKIFVFVANAVLAGLAGLIMTSRLNSAEPLAGQGYEIEAISIVVLGGTSANTGNVTVIGTVLACFIINIIENGLILVGVSTHYQRIVTGTILLIAVFFSERNRRKTSEF